MNASGFCAGPVLRRIRMETGGGDELLEVISVGLDGGVCRDIARPFDSVEELETFMGSSSTCDKALDWCAAEGSELIGRG